MSKSHYLGEESNVETTPLKPNILIVGGYGAVGHMIAQALADKFPRHERSQNNLWLLYRINVF